MNTIAQEFDNLLDTVQAIILSFLLKLGPFFVALMPALFTAYAIYFTFRADAGEQLALVFAFVVGLAMETVGIVATHTATDLYNGVKRGTVDIGKFWLMVALVPVYVFGVAGVVYFSGDAFTDLVRSLGIASPFLTCIVYVAVALARDLISIKQTEAEAEKHNQAIKERKLDHELTMEVQRMKLEHERKMEKDRLNAELKKERLWTSAEPPQIKTENSEHSAEYDELLQFVRESSAEKPFRPRELESWLDRGKTSVYDIINYGLETGQVHQVKRGQYVMNGKSNL